MKQESEKPPCFNSEREYEQWKALLVRSMEKGVTICDDCTNEYRKKNEGAIALQARKDRIVF